MGLRLLLSRLSRAAVSGGVAPAAVVTVAGGGELRELRLLLSRLSRATASGGGCSEQRGLHMLLSRLSRIC